jgi:hypothetical protein
MAPVVNRIVIDMKTLPASENALVVGFAHER